MAAHSSILAWTGPWTEEHGGLLSMGLQRVGHDLTTKQEQYLKYKFTPGWQLQNLQLLSPFLDTINIDLYVCI